MSPKKSVLCCFGKSQGGRRKNPVTIYIDVERSNIMIHSRLVRASPLEPPGISSSRQSQVGIQNLSNSHIWHNFLRHPFIQHFSVIIFFSPYTFPIFRPVSDIAGDSPRVHGRCHSRHWRQPPASTSSCDSCEVSSCGSCRPRSCQTAHSARGSQQS